MSYTELIHELLDGTLEQSKEEQLFLALASNHDLRNELKQFIQFDLAVKNDMEAYQPEPESQDKIFAALGIPMAATIGGAVAGSTLSNPLWYSKLWQPMLLGIGSALLGAILSFFIFNNQNENIDNINYADGKLIEKSDLGINRTCKPFVYSYSIDTIVKEKTVVKYIKGEDRIVYIEKEDNNNNSDNLAKIQNFKNDNYKEDVFARNDNGGFNKINNIGQYEKYDFSNEKDFLKKFNLEFKGNEDWSIPGATIQRSSYPVFNNSSLSLLYDINPDLKVGLEARQEYFYQEYNGIGTDGLAYNYFQHTNYISAGVMARYNLYNYGATKMFIQPAISLNQVGAIGRAMIGTEYTFIDQISLILGLEASVLQFKHQGNNFYSPKISLHYGVRINP